jgi:sarcosine oxidase, subunit gamma
VAEARDSAIGSTRPGHYGTAEPGVSLAEATIASAWNVQGDPARPAFVEEARRLFGVALPLEPNTTARTDKATALWLGPASWLLVAHTSERTDYAARRDALNTAGGALFDVSASRVAWMISGPRAMDVLAKGCPLDFHPRAFATGACAQSVFGHVNILICKRNDDPTFTVMVPRSFAHHVWHAFCDAAAQYGYRVLPPGPFR